MEVHTYNLCTEEVEAEESVTNVQGHPKLHTTRTACFNQPVSKGEKSLFYIITKDVIKIEIDSQDSFIIHLVSARVIQWHPLSGGTSIFFFNVSVFYTVLRIAEVIVDLN